jgi:hypothetical protein
VSFLFVLRSPHLLRLTFFVCGCRIHVVISSLFYVSHSADEEEPCEQAEDADDVPTFVYDADDEVTEWDGVFNHNAPM